MGPTKTLCWTFRSLKNSSPSPTLSKTPCVLFFVLLHDFYILSTSVAFGVAVAFPWWMAGAPLHRAGEDQEEPIVPAVVPEQWDSQPASQAEGGGRGRAAVLAGPSDRDRDWGVFGRGGRHLHDSQSPQRCHPGVLHVLLLSDATGVCVCDSPLKHFNCGSAVRETLNSYIYLLFSLYYVAADPLFALLFCSLFCRPPEWRHLTSLSLSAGMTRCSSVL